LLEELGQKLGGLAVKPKEWPKKPHILSGKVRRLAPNLRKAGIVVEFDREDGSKGSAKRTRKRCLKKAGLKSEAKVGRRCGPGRIGGGCPVRGGTCSWCGRWGQNCWGTAGGQASPTSRRRPGGNHEPAPAAGASGREAQTRQAVERERVHRAAVRRPGLRQR